MDAMDRDSSDGLQKFENPISEDDDALQKKASRDFDGDDAVDPTQDFDAPSVTKGKLRVAKPDEIVEENLLEELEVTTEDVDMDPLSLLGTCWGKWKVMTCAERMDAIKTVRGHAIRLRDLEVS